MQFAYLPLASFSSSYITLTSVRFKPCLIISGDADFCVGHKGSFLLKEIEELHIKHSVMSYKPPTPLHRKEAGKKSQHIWSTEYTTIYKSRFLTQARRERKLRALQVITTGIFHDQNWLKNRFIAWVTTKQLWNFDPACLGIWREIDASTYPLTYV